MRLRLLLGGLVAVSASNAFAQSMPRTALDFLDADGNVQVTRSEIIQQMDLFFDPMDTNGNGQLEFSEVESFMSRDVFDAADANANGTVSKSEYRKQVVKDFEAADVDGNGVLN